jgi:phage terminase small subunit
MRKTIRAKPPESLSPEAKSWWKKILDCYEVDDDAGMLLLGTAMESFDRMREAQRILATDGLCPLDRFNKPRQHPATLIERDAKNLMLRALKALNLDVVPGSPLQGGK